jgi:hypothetical protein
VVLTDQLADRSRPPPARRVGAGVDQGDVRLARSGPPDQHVLQLEVAVGEARLVQRAERAQHAADERASLVQVERAGSRDAAGERLRVAELGGHVQAAVLQADLGRLGQVLVPHPAR